MGESGEEVIEVFYRSMSALPFYLYLFGFGFIIFGLICAGMEYSTAPLRGASPSAVLLILVFFLLGIVFFILPSIYARGEMLIVTRTGIVHKKGGVAREIPLEEVADVVVSRVSVSYARYKHYVRRFVEGIVLVLGRDGTPLVKFKTYDPERVRKVILYLLRHHRLE